MTDERADGVSASAEVRGVQMWMALDLWMALGFDSQEFAPYVEAEGWADTWSKLLDVVRHPKPTCLAPLNGDDWCVLRDGHIGPHYGADDVGRPNDLLAKFYAVQHP